MCTSHMDQQHCDIRRQCTRQASSSWSMVHRDHIIDFYYHDATGLLQSFPVPLDVLAGWQGYLPFPDGAPSTIDWKLNSTQAVDSLLGGEDPPSPGRSAVLEWLGSYSVPFCVGSRLIHCFKSLYSNFLSPALDHVLKQCQ